MNCAWFLYYNKKGAEVEKYAKTVSIKTIKLSFLKRWKFMVCFFSVITISSLIIVFAATRKSYTSTATLSKNWAFTSETYNIITKGINDDILENIEKSTKENNIKYSSGKDISLSDLKKGISFSALNTGSNLLAVAYTSQDSSITVFIVNEMANCIVESYMNFANMNGLKIYDKATSFSTNDNRGKIIALVMIFNIVSSFSIPFIYEIYDDKVHDKEDVQLMGGVGFELLVKK